MDELFAELPSLQFSHCMECAGKRLRLVAAPSLSLATKHTHTYLFIHVYFCSSIIGSCCSIRASDAFCSLIFQGKKGKHVVSADQYDDVRTTRNLVRRSCKETRRVVNKQKPEEDSSETISDARRANGAILQRT